MKENDHAAPAVALWSQLVRDLAHIKALRKRAEAGDPEAERQFWELARGMEVKLAIHWGMVGEEGAV